MTALPYSLIALGLWRARAFMAKVDTSARPLRSALMLFTLVASAGALWHVSAALMVNLPLYRMDLAVLIVAASTACYAAYLTPALMLQISKRLTDLARASKNFEDHELSIQAFEGSPIGLAMISMEGEWLRANAEVERITGYSTLELTSGMTWMQITSPETLASDQEQVAAVISGAQRRYSMEKEYITKSGELVPVTITVALLRLTDREDRFLVHIADRSLSLARAQRQALAKSDFESALASKEARIENLEKALGVQISARIANLQKTLKRQPKDA
tara:strand:- start:8646 stop:9473 length:828 start_codon:yes stop_codon:yes gene_type:complete